ncbi:MAG: F0F1 ATP synthase subunit alpha, partial [Planctomycetia bacterium]
FRELEAFAQLGTELDKATQSQLDRGYRMVEILKQPQFQPYDVIDQVLSIYAGTQGYLDTVDPKQVLTWETEFLKYMKEEKGETRALLEKEQKLTDEVAAQLREACTAFGERWRLTRTKAAGAVTPAAAG